MYLNWYNLVLYELNSFIIIIIAMLLLASILANLTSRSVGSILQNKK